MSTKRAVIKQIDGIALAGKADSGHWVAMDGPEGFGGSNAGTRPKELVLLALGGCTGSDVVSILRKKRARVDGFEVRMSAEQSDEHPQVYKSIHMEFILRGDDLKPADIERAIELSETKYCSVSAMLRGTVTITHAYRIEPTTVTA